MVAGYNAAADRIEIEVGRPVGKVLDLGCNTGAGMEALDDRWIQAVMYGLEPVAEFAERARARGFIVDAHPVEENVFPDNFFDFVFSRHSLEHVADRQAAVAQILRILRPGGLLYVQAPIEPGGSKNALHRSPFQTLAELRGAFAGAEEVYWGPQATVAEIIVRKKSSF